jgi:hypothetical protein
MKNILNSGPYFKKGEQGVYFEHGPAWHGYVDALIDGIDALSGHRLCNTFSGIQQRMDKKRTTINVPLPASEVRRMYSELGWDYPDWHEE